MMFNEMIWYKEPWFYFLLIGFLLFVLAIVVFELGNKQHPSIGFFLLLFAAVALILLCVALYVVRDQAERAKHM